MMWMMGYNYDGGDFDSIQDPFTAARKLRPLMPRPAAASPPCFSRIHGGTDLLALNHHLAMAEQNKRELTTAQQVVVSTRWNPTPEQLQTLEEMYRRGTRTPSADQIQQITGQLRRYGKIEGKNVFYWFQNHKARERQKRRRHLESLCDDEHQQHELHPHNTKQTHENIEKRQEPASGANRRAFEVEQTKNWASLTNLSSPTIPEKTAQRASAECKGVDGWLQFDDIDDDADISQQRRNATWRMKRSSATTVPSQDKMQHHQDFINILLDPYNSVPRQNLEVYSRHHGGGGGGGWVEDPKTQTLQLFPLQGGGGGQYEEAEEESVAAVNSVTPYRYFEFLPLKN